MKYVSGENTESTNPQNGICSSGTKIPEMKIRGNLMSDESPAFMLALLQSSGNRLDYQAIWRARASITLVSIVSDLYHESRCLIYSIPIIGSQQDNLEHIGTNKEYNRQNEHVSYQ